LYWVNGALATQGMKVFDFTSSWTDGDAFIALTNYLLSRHEKEPIDATAVRFHHTHPPPGP